MNDIYLIRHTTPAVAKGICYGQTDLDVTESFRKEAEIILRHLPKDIAGVHSSPLRRCALLAAQLFPGHAAVLHPALMELNCGHWEMKNWDDLPKEEMDSWMKDFVNIRVPGGESYLDLHERVTRCFTEIRRGLDGTRALVAHGGVIRSILAHITGTPLIDSFKVFSLHYGCVIRLYEQEGQLQYEVLSNRPPEEKEQHKPSSFYNKA